MPITSGFLLALHRRSVSSSFITSSAGTKTFAIHAISCNSPLISQGIAFPMLLKSVSSSHVITRFFLVRTFAAQSPSPDTMPALPCFLCRSPTQSGTARRSFRTKTVRQIIPRVVSMGEPHFALSLCSRDKSHGSSLYSSSSPSFLFFFSGSHFAAFFSSSVGFRIQQRKPRRYSSSG